MPKDNLNLADKFAIYYDQNVVKNKWVGPTLLFDMVKNLINPGQELLDLGIGTGASSLPFYNAGLIITGVDGSKEMLNECQKKNFTQKLIVHDLELSSLPLPSFSFDIVISNALLHLINPIDQLFSESKRVLRENGIFAFTFDETEKTSEYNQLSTEIWESKTATGVWTYKHQFQYISGLLKSNGFMLITKKRFLAFKNEELKKEFYFMAVVARKINK